MATKKISELEAITEADGSDVLAIVDVSEGKTNKITKNNLLIGAGHSIEMSLNQETYALTLTLKNAAGTELSTASIDLPNENAITNISYNNGVLTLTKQSGATSTVDISGLINGLATETALNNLASAIKGVIGISTNTYNVAETYNTGDIVVQNEKIYKANQDNITGTFDSSKWDEISLYEYQKLQDEAIEENYKVITKLQEDVEDLTERVEDAENNEMTYTPTPATSHYLQDSADARFRRFIPIGRSVQDGDPTPENPVPIKNTGDNVNLCKLTQPGLVMNTNNTIVSSEYSKTIVDTRNINSLVVSGDFSLLGDNVLRAGGCNEYPDIGVTGTRFTNISANQNVIDTTNYNYIIFTFVVTGGRTEEKDLAIENSFKIEQGTKATPYSPYGCGNVNEKIQNKNLFDKSKATSGRYVKNTDGTLGYSDTLSASDFIKVRANVTYYQSNVNNYYSCLYDEDKNFIKQINSNAFTPTKNGYMRTSFLSTNIDIVQVEQDSTATDYVAHSEQNISFPLAQGQKFYEGSHPDDDEKVHHKRKEKVFTGTENWSPNGSITIDGQIYSSWYLKLNDIKDNYDAVISNYFRGNVSRAEGNSIYSRKISNDTAIRLAIDTNIIPPSTTSARALKNWLAEKYSNNVPVIAIYELAEEQTEDFTEEQKTAWEEWKKARTYKNVTHISSEDETPANVEIEYVRDINTIDDRITALEPKVDLLEE